MPDEIVITDTLQIAEPATVQINAAEMGAVLYDPNRKILAVEVQYGVNDGNSFVVKQPQVWFARGQTVVNIAAKAPVGSTRDEVFRETIATEIKKLQDDPVLKAQLIEDGVLVIMPGDLIGPLIAAFTPSNFQGRQQV